MKKIICLCLLAALLLAGCESKGEQVEPATTPEASGGPSAEPTPSEGTESEGAITVTYTPSPEPTPTPTPEPTPTPTPAPTPTPEPYDYSAPVPEREAVEEEWFADAVLIGDSRTEGMRLYSGLKAADYICYKGLTVKTVVENEPVIQAEGEKVGVLQALAEKQYKKVYLCLGLNELGYPTDQGFVDYYTQVVDKLIELQPDADIYLQAVLPVNTEVCRQANQPSYVENQRVAAFNTIIADIAEEKQLCFVDVREALVDENGELPAELTSDGVHMRKDGYVAWYEYLKTHTVEENG